MDKAHSADAPRRGLRRGSGSSGGGSFRRNSQELFEATEKIEEEDEEDEQPGVLSRSSSDTSIDSTANTEMLDLVASITKPPPEDEAKSLPCTPRSKQIASNQPESPKLPANVRCPPLGVDRLPSAMRPPRRGHYRSASHGGASYHLQSDAGMNSKTEADQQNNTQRGKQQQTAPVLPGPSVLKKTSAFTHRRVFSHGQIKFNTDSVVPDEEEVAMTASGDPPPTTKGHRRQGSKTEFILPPGHEERERKRNLQRSGSRAGSVTAVTVAEIGAGPVEDEPRPYSTRQRQGSGHRRLPSRSDSLGYSFRGHSRQASRTDSIYTLRATTATNTTVKDKLFFWNRCRRRKLTLPAAVGGGHANGFAGDKGQTRSHRTVVPNHVIPADVPSDKHPNAGFANNYVRTTKYTLLTFLPKNLFEQFHRFANLYFLFIVLLNWVPAINAFGKEISMLPVIFVLGVTAIKDIFEDRRRYLSDKRVNNSTCRVYNRSMGRYTKCQWKDLKVGDFVHLSCNEMIPADILVLRSADEHGLCYIDTQNLDGEANLKQREVPRGILEKQSTFAPQDFRSNLECDTPTTKIYRFHGSIIHPWGERVPVGKDNLLLRECVLKNTDFVEGLVVYAGHESKAMLNNGGPRYKRSKLERRMNGAIVWCVVTLLVLCFIGAIGSGVWLDSFDGYVPPFLNKISGDKIAAAYEGFLTFWTFVIILQVIIPMSLYVTIECTKLIHIYLINQDVRMYDDVCGKSVECRALNIPEELGQVQYIFCDKTGTLTENNMVFKRCTIGGCDYAHNSFTSKFNLASAAKDSNNAVASRATIPVNPTLAERLNSMDIQYLIEGNSTKTKLQSHAQQVQDFFLLLAVCNTVIVAKYPHHDHMNASGVICNSATNGSTASKRNRGEVNNAAALSSSYLNEDSEENVVSTTPPLSMMSTGTVTTSLSSNSMSSTTAPLQPDPGLAAKTTEPSNPRRSKMFDFLTGGNKPPLSPIASSPESTPSESPMARPKHLQLPGIFSKLVSSSSSLHRHSTSGSARASPTPTPLELRPIYEAESPDELALVDAAYAYNVKLLRRTPSTAVVSLPGEGLTEFEVLHVLPFDSVRKRMSIILRHPITKERVLFCKGADSSVFPRLKAPSPYETVVEKTKQQLNAYAKQGLRVLCMAKKVLDDLEYEDWVTEHTIAENALHQRDRLLFESYNRMEWDLTLLGATGIEDKLQEGVPETIDNLRSAGIVVWVLTGDKQETAINIAYSCQLFSQNMEVIKINARSRDAAEATIKFHLEAIEKNETERKEPAEQPAPTSRLNGFTKKFRFSNASTTSTFSNSSSNSFETDNLSSARPSFSEKPSNRALVIDGKTLIYILDKRAKLQGMFLRLTGYCSSVLCCRATPLQKAYIVRIVKENLKMHTLAIGDGANDVSMIQTADVGIGISGQEGMQAVMASDFAISRFKYLERLLLVHGHWNYDRLARMVLYFFYKNAAFVFVCFWYQLYCGFSGAVMIDQMYLMLYNLFFTSLPPMAIGVLDQDAPDTVLSGSPVLYAQGRLSQVYTRYSFWFNMLDALYQSLVIYFIAAGAYQSSDVGIWEYGTVICTQCLIVMSLHLAIETKSWTIVHWSSIILSIFVYFLFGLLYNGICVNCHGLQNPFWVMQHMMGTSRFWMVVLLSAVTSLLPRIIVRAMENTSRPNPVTETMLIARAKQMQTGGGSAAAAAANSNSWTKDSRNRGGSQDTEMTAIMS